MSKTISRILIFAGAALFLAAAVVLMYSYVEDYLAARRAQHVLEQVWGTGETAQHVSVAAENPEEVWGHPIIGIVSIPKLDVTLPVFSELTDELLEISVCRFTGEVLDKPQRLIISGHNYRSHFGRLPALALGDEVHFTTGERVTYRYSVTEITEIPEQDTITVHEGGDWDITLLTCNADHTRRVLVRCREIQN